MRISFLRDEGCACENEVITKLKHCKIEEVIQMLNLQFNPLVEH